MIRGQARGYPAALLRSWSGRCWQLRCLLLLSATVTLGCSKPLSEAECFELLDVYTDKLVQQARPSASSAERSEMQLQARQKALLDPEFGKCPQRVTQKQLRCARQAASADEIERCLL